MGISNKGREFVLKYYNKSGEIYYKGWYNRAKLNQFVYDLENKGEGLAERIYWADTNEVIQIYHSQEFVKLWRKGKCK
jgi:hypothetical protein